MVGRKDFMQNPKLVDTAIGWIILAGAATVLLPILGRNVVPYQEAIAGVAPGIIRWIMRIPVLGWAFGLMAFAAVQFGEVWPLLSEETPEEAAHREWRKAVAVRWLVSAACFLIDAMMCSRFWPVLKPGISVQMAIAGFRLDMIDQANFWQTLLTVFGLMGFIMLFRFIRRVA